MRQVDRYKSLQQLEGKDWGEPNFDSHLVIECHRLHRVPLRNFTDGNLRIMIGQDIGLEYLVPIALERLQEEPLVEGDFYPGDLLVSVLCSDKKLWQHHPEWRGEMLAITKQTIASFSSRPEIACKIVAHAVTEAFGKFQGRLPAT